MSILDSRVLYGFVRKRSFIIQFKLVFSSLY